MSLDEETKNIEAVLIIEIIGRPPEHLVETLKNMIKQIDQEKGVRVVSESINEPVLMKDQKHFYTTFAEVEIAVDEVLDLAAVLFKYMPAHVEIISPELIALTNAGWNEVMNELIRRLHGYDEIARIIQVEKNALEKRVKELEAMLKQQKSSTKSSPKASSKKKSSSKKAKNKSKKASKK